MTRHLLFGFNVVTLIGFAAMAIGSNLARMGRGRAGYGFVLMGIGTGLVFLGLYFGGAL